MTTQTIINADCLEYMKTLPDKSFDLVLTDPPYPDYHTELYGYKEGIIDFLKDIPCRQLIFWSAKVPFPLDYTAIHIWDKKVGVGSMYERIYERNGGAAYKVYNHYLINSTVAASLARDIFASHPSQKPIELMKELVTEYSKEGDNILEPFAGSGSTLVACKHLNRNCVGIEISEKYCKIAQERLDSTPTPMF